MASVSLVTKVGLGAVYVILGAAAANRSWLSHRNQHVEKSIRVWRALGAASVAPLYHVAQACTDMDQTVQEFDAQTLRETQYSLP